MLLHNHSKHVENHPKLVDNPTKVVDNPPKLVEIIQNWLNNQTELVT